jgi:hypothetical protein
MGTRRRPSFFSLFQGHAFVEQVFRSQFGIRVDQHPVGGLPLAGMARDRSADVDI